VLLAALPAARAEIDQTGTQPHRRYQLPASTWWLVIHDQCNDTLH
jgi:hypothetical protein